MDSEADGGKDSVDSAGVKVSATAGSSQTAEPKQMSMLSDDLTQNNLSHQDDDDDVGDHNDDGDYLIPPSTPKSDSVINSSIQPSSSWELTNESTLQSTNKAIHDLERKLSIGSTSSNVTHVSQASSVVIDPSKAGVGKSLIQSTVLDYLKDTSFDPNNLFDERHHKFVTKFNKEYSSSPSSSPVPAPVPAPSLASPINGTTLPLPGIVVTNDDDEEDTLSLNSESLTTKSFIQSPTSTPTSSPRKGTDSKQALRSSPNKPPTRTSPNRSPRSPQRRKVQNIDGTNYLNKDDMQLKPLTANDSVATDMDVEFMHPSVDESFDDLDDDDDFYDHEGDMIETTDDMLIPPSPPRSPPKEIDPDMLYGLYDFNGPDPSHCTLARNEPVILVNDQDNYWWLIRKLTKAERIAHRLKHKRVSSGCLINSVINSDGPSSSIDRTSQYTELEDEEGNIMSDEEDGKTGFVPAECLETFGERLARLNCYKNEELEKSGVSMDTLKPQIQKTPSNKTVMFHVEEAPNSLAHDDEDNESDQEFPTEFYDRKHITDSLLKPPNKSVGEDDDDKDSEVFSDLYPANVELVVKKKKGNSFATDVPLTSIKSRLVDNSSNLLTPLRGVQSEESLPHQLESLSRLQNLDEWQALERPSVHQNYDDVSIGSFSPDTPVSEFTRNRSPQDHELESTPPVESHLPLDSKDNEESNSPASIIRRSLILDRLNQVTSDIQQLQLNDYEAFNEQGENVLVKWNKEERNEVTRETDDDDKEVKLSSFNPYAQAGGDVIESPEESPLMNQSSPLFSKSCTVKQTIANEEDHDEDDYDVCDINGIRSESRISNEVITPLTLTNSLTSGVKATGGKESVSSQSARGNYKTDSISSRSGSALSLELKYSSRDEIQGEDFVQTPTNTIMERKELTPGSQTTTTVIDESNDGLANTLENTSRYSPELTVESSKMAAVEGDSVVETSIDSLMIADTGEEDEEVGSGYNPVAFGMLLPEQDEVAKSAFADRRKSKPVHDMFAPVLNKFDDLAKKLAELEDLL